MLKWLSNLFKKPNKNHKKAPGVPPLGVLFIYPEGIREGPAIAQRELSRRLMQEEEDRRRRKQIADDWLENCRQLQALNRRIA